MGACASGVAAEPQLLPGQQPQQRPQKRDSKGRPNSAGNTRQSGRNSKGQTLSNGKSKGAPADRNSKGKTASKGRDGGISHQDFLMKQMQNDMRNNALGGMMDQSGSNLGISGVASFTAQPSSADSSNLSGPPISAAAFSSVINSNNASRGDQRIKYNASPVVPAVHDPHARSSAEATPAPYEHHHRASSPSEVVSISHSTTYLTAPPPAIGPTVYAAHSSAVSVVSSPNSTAPPSPTSSGDYASVPALLLPWSMQQKAARQLEKGMEDLLSHPPLFLSLAEHPAAPGALPPVPPTRIQPLPIPSWSPFSSPRLSPGQEAPMLRRKLNSLAQKHVRMVLERMTPAQLETLACHSKNQPRNFLAQHASATGARVRPATGIQATPHGTPAASTTLPPPALVEHLVLGSPPGLNASSLSATPSLTAAGLPSLCSSSMPTVSLDTPAPLPHSTAQCAPASENLSQLEYRLNLLAAKSEWKAQRSYGVFRISLFGPDAYRYQGIGAECIPPAPHQDQRVELEPVANSVLGFMRHTLHRTPSAESSPLQLPLSSSLCSAICSATASPMSGPLSSGGMTPNYLSSSANSARSSCNANDKAAPTCNLAMRAALRPGSSFLDLPGALQLS